MTNPYPGGAPFSAGPPGWQHPQQSRPQPEAYQQPFPYGQPQFLPEPKKRSRIWVSVVIAVSIAVVLGAGTFLLIRTSFNRSANAAGAASTSGQSTAPAKPAPPLPPEPGRSRPGPNTPPGWQSVGSPSGLDYDVPGDWTVQKPSMVLSWQKPCDTPLSGCAIRSVLNAATRAHPPQNGCTDSNVSAVAGFLSPNPNEMPAAERQNIADALEAEAKRIPDIYTDWGKDSSVPPPPPPPIARSDVRQFKIDGADALQAGFTVTGIDTNVSCNPPSSVYTVVATTNTEGKVITFVVQLDQGYPQAPDLAIAQKIIDTLRFEKK